MACWICGHQKHDSSSHHQYCFSVPCKYMWLSVAFCQDGSQKARLHRCVKPIAHASPLDPKWTCIAAYCCWVCVAQPLTFWDHLRPRFAVGPFLAFSSGVECDYQNLAARTFSYFDKLLVNKKGHDFGEAWGPGWASSECPLWTCCKKKTLKNHSKGDLWGVLTLENIFSHPINCSIVAEPGICLEPLLMLPSMPLPQSPT